MWPPNICIYPITAKHSSQFNQSKEFTKHLLYYGPTIILGTIKDKLRHIKIFKHLFEQKLIQNRHIYTMEFYAAETMKELIPFATAWMEEKSIMLSEISQAVRDKYHVISPLLEHNQQKVK